LGAGEISGGEIGFAGALEKEGGGEGDDRRARGLSGGDARAGGVAGVRDQAVSAAERGERVRAGWAGVRV